MTEPCEWCGNPSARQMAGEIVTWLCMDCYLKVKNKQRFWSVILIAIGFIAIMFEILVILGLYGYFPPFETATYDDVLFGLIFVAGAIFMIITGYTMYRNAITEIKRVQPT